MVGDLEVMLPRASRISMKFQKNGISRYLWSAADSSQYLKPSPSANVENQHYPEAGPACLNIVEKSLESRPVRKLQATLTEVRIRLYYVHAE